MLKPWTWKQIAEKSEKFAECNSFAKKYGEIGTIALELANRLKYPFKNDHDRDLIEWKAFTGDCGCAMCKQWHHKWSIEQVRQFYKKLYDRTYRNQSR